jgi:predicted ATPase
MEIKIDDFGPIKKFEMDLSKDLVITYGKNNIGKSYALSVVYLLLKSFLEIDGFNLENLLPGEVSTEKSKVLEKKIREEKECNNTDNINTIIKNVFNKALAGELENSFKNTFGQLSAIRNYKVEGSPLIQINILNHEILFEADEKIQVKKFSLDKDIFGKFSAGESGYRIQEDRYILFVSDRVDFTELLNTFISDRIRSILNSIKDEFGEIYYLPASRSGLIMGMQSMIPLMAELSKIRTLLTRKIDLPAMPEPIADYILQLAEIRGIPTRDKGLSSSVRYLEKKILGGEIGFDTTKGHLTYSPEGSQLILDMNSVSSMVSELSPLAAFIKYVLRENRGNSTGQPRTVIFIEEPEAHLHPQAQVMLVEMFIKLIEAGVKVIITSHSNYIFNKLSNMLIAGTLSPARFMPIVLKDTPGGSVSRSMCVDELGIEDENFIDTADALYEERELIIEKLNKGCDDR